MIFGLHAAQNLYTWSEGFQKILGQQSGRFYSQVMAIVLDFTQHDVSGVWTLNLPLRYIDIRLAQKF